MSQAKYQTEKVEEKPKSKVANKPQSTQEEKPEPKSTSSEKPSNQKSNTANINNQPSQDPMKKSTKKSSSKKNIIIAIIVVLAGIGTGYFIQKSTTSQQSTTQVATDTTPATADEVVMGEVYGAEAGDDFADETEGVLVKGGIGGEGSHHILREGGPSKNVYLTSSVLDLNLFNEHRVKVWGETFQAQKAGWLMDVGRVEVVELNAEKPFEEDEAEE